MRVVASQFSEQANSERAAADEPATQKWSGEGRQAFIDLTFEEGVKDSNEGASK